MTHPATAGPQSDADRLAWVRLAWLAVELDQLVAEDFPQHSDLWESIVLAYFRDAVAALEGNFARAAAAAAEARRVAA